MKTLEMLINSWIKQDQHGRRDKAFLARKVGVSGATVTRWAQGAAIPDAANCRKLAEIFGTTVIEVMAAAGKIPESEYKQFIQAADISEDIDVASPRDLQKLALTMQQAVEIIHKIDGTRLITIRPEAKIPACLCGEECLFTKYLPNMTKEQCDMITSILKSLAEQSKDNAKS